MYKHFQRDMNKLKKAFSSMITTVILLVIFAIAIGYATFAENYSGLEYAREIVYNAIWFEILMVLLVINLIGSIFQYRLINKKKWSVLLFHMAFICMILGAAITRYFGSEGIMHIRQGETTNEVTSEKKAVGLTVEYNGEKVEKTFDATFTQNKSNNFSHSIQVANKTITIESEIFIPNSIETIVPDENGEAALSLFVMNQMNAGMDFILLNNETAHFNGMNFSFGKNKDNTDILFSLINEELFFKSSFPVGQMSMMSDKETLLLPDFQYQVQKKTIYKIENVIFVLKNYLVKAQKNISQVTPEMNKTGIVFQPKDAIVFRVTDGTESKRIHVICSENEVSAPVNFEMGNTKISVKYGKLPHILPFEITLRKFELERYAGSNSPSSYASEITLTDHERKVERPFRIFMNNILKYRGYRFFQSSYDQDEKGTILSVSHDFWGTLISYIGYFLLMLGMIWTLLNKNSRFRTVLKLSNELQKSRKSKKTFLLLTFVLFSVGTAFSAKRESTHENHITELNSLLIQDESQGRIEPFHTYASDVLRKIAKKTSVSGLTAVEVIMGMTADPAAWKNEPIIKIANTKLASELGISQDYATYNQLFDFDNGGEYRLREKVDQVYHKERSTQNKYDKEIINLDERINICYQIFNGNLLNIFPVLQHPNQKWEYAQRLDSELYGIQHQGHEAEHTYGVHPPVGMGGMSYEQINAIMGNEVNTLKSSFVPSETPEILFNSYLKAFSDANSSGNWHTTYEQLLKIKNYQNENGVNLPSKSKIKLEILYNELDLFSKLAMLYAFLGFCLLVLHLVDIFSVKSKVEKVLNTTLYVFIPIFVIYSLGLGMRWYISAHAPWSNGYETMIFIGWAAALSGLLFARKSPISLAVTGILTGVALFVAGMSWMNPEITNLVPVLKSYWLIIHVAIITSSYGFLAMAALLGILNLSLMSVRNNKNGLQLQDSIQEISYIIEMALIIGLVMLTIGCFIGGIWANESWGRYWGWDPKETWALVSILVYTVILHLRNIPQANHQFVLSTLSVVGFSTIIMTFFGVNYYLSGMHSYAQGNPPAVPGATYVFIIFIGVLVYFAYRAEKKNNYL